MCSRKQLATIRRQKKSEDDNSDKEEVKMSQESLKNSLKEQESPTLMYLYANDLKKLNFLC